jgi:hypothetical protein
MHRWGIVLFAAGVAAAQQAAPVGVVRGTLIERDKTQSGEMFVRLGDNHVYSFQFDERTYVEKEKRPVTVAVLETGDTVEILSDAGKSPRQRYARTVKVVTEDPPAPPYRVRLRRRPLEEHSMLDDLFPRGNLTFAGIVASVGRDSFLLRTRNRTETRILLRPDTRYVRSGVPVEAAGLAVNTRVFVRAGKTIYDEVEAFQVIWGDILKPD